jgi:hypothetical protein
MQLFCRIFAAVYFFGALAFALTPGLTWQLVTLGQPSQLSAEALFWNALAVAMMVAIALACLVVAGHPRERRHALVPVVGAKLTSSLLGLVHGLAHAGADRRGLLAIVATDFPLFLLTLWIYRSASPGVHSAPARQAPPAPEPEQKPVSLGVPTPDRGPRS